MAVTLAGINLRATDPDRLATFYAALLLGTVDAFEGYRYVRAAGVPLLCLQPSTGSPPRGGALHLDLGCPPQERESEVARAVSLGAVHRWDVLEEVPHVQWSTLADPEGNDFCLASPRG